MKQDIFVGIDGGGTKSKVRIENADGELLGQGMGGPANIRLSIHMTWQSIYQGLAAALPPHISLHDRDHYRFHVGMGLAGCEMKEAYEKFLQEPHPFTTLKVISDAHIACVGAHKAREGSIIIVGTGVVGYQIEQGKSVKVGGWGFPNDDIGGGAWLGLEAVRLTFQWLDHRIEKSPLVEDVFAFFNQDIEHFVSWSTRANSTEFARLAPIVINHSQQEEIAAIRLMKKAAHAIDHIGTTLVKMQVNKEGLLPCSLFGGVAPFIEPWLSEELHQHLVPREAGATAGAILMIREYLNLLNPCNYPA